MVPRLLCRLGQTLTFNGFYRFPIGQISASLAAMHRTVEDYDSMAKREIIKAKQEKAMMYVPYLTLQLRLCSVPQVCVLREVAESCRVLVGSALLPFHDAN